MIYIYKDRIINIQWTVMKGTSQVRENFDRALLKMFLIGPHEKYLLEATAEEGVVSAEVPAGLPEGTYSVELIYVKNWQSLQRPPEIHKHQPHDCRFNDRCIMRSRKDDLFAITEYETESENIGHGEVIVRLKTSVASYGYDGLSAYEIAVMRGDFTGSEGEWMDTVGRSINMYFYSYLGNAKDTRLKVPSYLRRKGLIITYVNDNGIVVTERYKGDALDDTAWGDDDNWDNLFDTSDYVKANNAYGFNVTAFGINGGRHTINTAIIDVPHEMRVLGHKITFAQHDGTWATYQLQSMSLSDYINPEKWVKLEGITNTGSLVINNQPDEEDITVDKDNLLKFADKEYSENSFSGLGRVHLRKNIIDDKNVLTQPMINKPNTIYIIQYDYDLNGQEITIPEDSKLIFIGGTINNGTLNCINTTIQQFNGTATLTGNCKFDNFLYTDNEDITQDSNLNLKFADKKYNPNNFSGFGRIYLRKNIVEIEQTGDIIIRKNILTQDMINEENTEYIIQYDYDLQGEEITIPDSCVLKFEGGSFNNGVIIGNKTKLLNYTAAELNCTLLKEFIGEKGNHISNYYKLEQRYNTLVNVPVDGITKDNAVSHLSKIVNYARELGADYYGLIINFNCDENGNNVVFNFKGVSGDITLADYENIIKQFSNVRNSSLEFLKFHTENNEVDSILNSPLDNKNKVITFLSNYKNIISDIIDITNRYYSNTLKTIVVFNEETKLIESRDADIDNSIVDICASIKSKGYTIVINNINSKIVSKPIFNVVDIIAQNSYLGGLSYKNGDTVISDVLSRQSINYNKSLLLNSIGKSKNFGITETGCSNNFISLISSGIWQSIGDNSQDVGYIKYLYFSTLSEILKDINLSRLGYWYVQYNSFLDNIYNSEYRNLIQEQIKKLLYD